MRRNLVLCVVAILLALVPAVALAEETLSPEALEIANSLNCPVCEGQSVRDSNSQLARQMREIIQEKLDAGESRDEILSFFADRYGVGILREPPKSGFVLTLWWGPVVGLVLGAVILGTFVLQRQRRRRVGAEHRPAAASGDDAGLVVYEERVLRELEGSDVGA